MLTQIFNSILSTSFTASLVITVVIIARFLLKKSPKIFSYALWAVVLFRLVCPVTFESDFAIIPSDRPIEIYNNFVKVDTVTLNDISQPIETEKLSNDMDFFPQGGIVDFDKLYHSNIVIDNDYVTEIDSNNSVVGGDITANNKYNLPEILSYVWLIGFIVMFYFGVREFVKLHKSLIGCTRWKDCQYGDNIYLCDNIKSPFVMGIFKAKIYIPSNIINRDLNYIISHEKHHIKRLDHITRIIGFIALSLHWFNPLVWIAFVLSGKDMELSCDEYVLGNNNYNNNSVDIRAEYSQALLYFACNLTNKHKLLAITPHAFGESGSTKERIKNIMTYKKTAVWVSCLLACIVGFSSIALASDKTVDEVDIIESDEEFVVDEAILFDEVEITEQEIFAVINNSITVGNKYADYIELVETYFDKGSQFADSYQLYTVFNAKKTNILNFVEPLEYPTLIKFNDENLYWINLNNDCFEYNFSTQNIRQLDIKVSHFEVNSNWLFYSYTVVTPDNLEPDNNLYLYNLNNHNTQIINEYKEENNYNAEKFYNRNFFVKFADDGSNNIVFFSNDSLVLYNPNTNEIEFEYAIDFNEILEIKSVTVSSDTIEIICSAYLYTIDRATNIGKLIEIVPEPLENQELLGIIGKIDDLNLTVLNKNNTPITNANIVLSPLYVTDKSYESYLVTDNNGLAVGQLNDMFPTGAYKIETWITTENGYDKTYVNQMITSDNYENLVVTMPTINQNENLYNASNRTDIYVLDVNENPIANALVEFIPTFPIPAIGTNYGFDNFNQFAYTDNDGKATFINLLEGDYMVYCSSDSAYSSSALITTTDGIDEFVFNILYENE